MPIEALTSDGNSYRIYSSVKYIVCGSKTVPRHRWSSNWRLQSAWRQHAYTGGRIVISLRLRWMNQNTDGCTRKKLIYLRLKRCTPPIMFFFKSIFFKKLHIVFLKRFWEFSGTISNKIIENFSLIFSTIPFYFSFLHRKN